MEQTAIFACGCFWCCVEPFQRRPGVLEVVAGYTGGRTENPTYEEIKKGDTGHMEAILVRYDSGLISYERLLDIFWKTIDPTDDGGQFIDRGSNYRTALFYESDAEREAAERSKSQLSSSGLHARPVVTPILRRTPFYRAEERHQQFFARQPEKYQLELEESGRNAFLLRIEKKWLRGRLDAAQYAVTQQSEEEEPFRGGALLVPGRRGLFVDVVSGEALFSSRDQREAPDGFPTFVGAVREGSVRLVRWGAPCGDRRVCSEIELRSAVGDSHLGFLVRRATSDGEVEECKVMSVALRFVPEAEMQAGGYGAFLGDL